MLESTQLMLAHGLDLFYTRLTPSRHAPLRLQALAGQPGGASCVQDARFAAYTCRAHRSPPARLLCWLCPCCRSFDMVPDDFPYALLVLIVVGMTVGTAVLSQLQTRAVVKAKWQ